MEGLLRDIGLAVRGLRRNPGFTAVAVLTLALGIGAMTTVFSVVYGVLFRPLPFPAADRFVEIVQVMPDRETGGTLRAGLTPDQFLNLQEHSTLLEGIGVFGGYAPRTLTGIPVPGASGTGIARSVSAEWPNSPIGIATTRCSSAPSADATRRAAASSIAWRWP